MFAMVGNAVFLIVSGLFVFISRPIGVWCHNKVTDCGLLEPTHKHIIPWVVNIYQLNTNGDYDFICSGTVVSQKIILTAAHCFYDDITKKIREATFIARVGQESKMWNATNNENIQTRKIPKDGIIITKEYKGLETHYSCNIAIVKLDADQQFNLNVPTNKACVYWDNDFIESQLEEKTSSLKVLVWEKERDSSFTVLKPSYVNFDMCYNSVATTFQPYLTFDKMCVQVKNLPSVSSIGSGLYARNIDNNRWYLIGIASEVTSANSKTFLTFIKLQPHLNWISNTAFLEVR